MKTTEININIDEASQLDIPNTHIGRSALRPNARRLLEGRAKYVDDILTPNVAHAVYLRSPLAHARIKSVNTEKATKIPGVIAIIDGKQMAKLCTPWVGTLKTLTGIKSPPQYPMAIDVARWQGEPVLAIVAETRKQAEDAMYAINIEWEELPAVTSMYTALEPESPLVHSGYTDNLCFERTINTGDIEEVFNNAAKVVEQEFHFGRHTGMPLETRSILADYDPTEQHLTVHQSHQAPHNMQDLYARHFGLNENAVRVICNDVGGSFGIKLHSYPDDFATIALAIILKRPVKYICDRLEAFVSDIHAREHYIRARLALSNNGEILGFDIDDLAGIGAYSVYPRTSATEGNQVISVIGGPYKHSSYRAHLRVAFQNKVPTSQYRGVGLPIACAVTESLLEEGARQLGIDPLKIRRRNVIPDNAYPFTGAAGIQMQGLSHEQCLDKLETLMSYPDLRAEQAELRKQGIYRGIGLAVLIEMTNPGASFYGEGGANISGQDVATIRLDSSGTITCLAGVGDQGQGTETIYAQIAADAIGVSMDDVRVVAGDTLTTPYGAGTWASRGAGIGGEAVYRAGLTLRRNILIFAAQVFNRDSSELTIELNSIIDVQTNEPITTLAALAHKAYFRPDTLPVDTLPSLTATEQYTQNAHPFLFTNGVQASYLEVDTRTGVIQLLNHWAVGDCGRIINPMLVNEQLRGGIVQGIGGALYEECLYDSNGSLKNGSFADYLTPMAAEMPDIWIDHVETPTETNRLGAKGTGEAGTAGAPAAILNAVNDAIAPFNTKITTLPITPERLLKALGKI